MKKFISLLLAMVMLVPTIAMADIAFSDLPSDHWSYTYVQTLVNDNTVNGYEDGTFKPDAGVTRAEFVKMIGKSGISFGKDFTDVPKDHWGYEYIMYSGMDVTGDSFRPDEPMTRDDVATLVWKRAGGKTGIKAAPAVTDGFTNKDAAAWVYTYGIMNGDDGVHLRPYSGITRAEAAAIICRSRAVNESTATVNFIDKADGGVLKTVFEKSLMFDATYNPEAKITNGELAKAGGVFLYEELKPAYTNEGVITTFESDYARDVYFMGSKVLGQENISLEFAGKNATVKDAVAYLAYCAFRKANGTLNYNDTNNYYPEITDTALTEDENKALTLAYNYGITLNANGVINPDKEITHKEMAALIVQFDALIGAKNFIVATPSIITFEKSKLNGVLGSYPKNSEEYPFIMESVPSYVYEAPFVNLKEAPAKAYEFAESFKGIFKDYTQNLAKQILNKTGATVNISFNPSMIYKSQKGHTLRAKLTVVDTAAAVALKDMIQPFEGVSVDVILNKGDEVYLDINTGRNVSSIIIPAEYSVILQVIK